ncbi:MAG: heavy-metal-associated domain-containing protein [Firmicutes bacterium]|nr:heavy-metal-associated domain-containing protein [Bacillota bacterium]
MALPRRQEFRVDGMSCQHCVQAIKDNVGKLHGIDRIEVDLDKQTVTVEYNAEQVDTEAIEGAIAGAGYDIVK